MIYLLARYMWLGSELKCNLANTCMIMFKVAGFDEEGNVIPT
jgi:hypothetical protein